MLKPAALTASVPGPVNVGVWQGGHAEVPIGVRPELQVEGVDIILGNSLAGSLVWTSGSSLPVLQAQNSHMIVWCAFLKFFLHVQ